MARLEDDGVAPTRDTIDPTHEENDRTFALDRRPVGTTEGSDRASCGAGR